MNKHKNRLKVFVWSLIFTIAIAGAVIGQSPREVPELPCVEIAAPAGSTLTFHAYAIGVQIYRWNGASWVLLAPAATLYADSDYRGKVGTHYGGPTWESNSGSFVTGSRSAACPSDGVSIAWLLLKKVSSDGPGIFARVSYIQRLNTVGGLAPSAPGSTIGDEAKIPYTAEYYFYRED